MIDTNKDSIPENKYAAMKPTLCTVDFIYIVSRHLVYSNSDYYLEREYSSPYVVILVMKTMAICRSFYPLCITVLTSLL